MSSHFFLLKAPITELRYFGSSGFGYYLSSNLIRKKVGPSNYFQDKVIHSSKHRIRI